LPKLTIGPPTPGHRVAVTPPEFEGTKVFHTTYLPPNWNPEGPPLPVIFEYTGNFHPNSGSTGKVEDAGLGFGLSGGRYIWVSLPYVNKDHTANEVTWWGDEAATIAYAKLNVPRIIEEFGADPNCVFLCGFSRGAIGVNYIGLHDDEVSKLWTAFITHDHFDGAKEWKGTTWGAPLEKYRSKAKERLNRVGDRPYLVSQNGANRTTEEYLRTTFLDLEESDPGNFTFHYIKTSEIFGEFPNRFAKAAHTDRWLLKPSKYRQSTWAWMDNVTATAQQKQ